MAYFKIGSTDFSNVVKGLDIQYIHNYTENTNALGNSVVEYITRKRTVTATIVPVNDTQMKALMDAVNDFNVSIQVLEPRTKALATLNCKVEDYDVAYYTIQSTKTQFQEFQITFTEL